MYEVWLGFPKLWEWIEGLFWWASGSLNSVIVPQLLLCLFYFYYVSRDFRVPKAYVVLAFFSSPMLFVHFESTLLDLPAGIANALAFFMLSTLIDDA